MQYLILNKLIEIIWKKIIFLLVKELFSSTVNFLFSLYIYASNYGIHIVLENNALTYKLKFTLRYKIDEKNIIKKFFGLFISRF